ncbi:MAG TPA: class I SAM-dependent methyltransferase [Candidatus Micrarchaeaceae archaeon]|nr:class I SAM-dependent methyltransferase [Candidatus Micrarchaeaceae archaeon]
MTSKETIDVMVNANRRNWNSRVGVHLDSDFYDVAGFVRERAPRLDPVTRKEVGDVSGKSLLHLQCHIGLDTISWVLVGAKATGVDFSVPALDAARDIAPKMEVEATFVESDVLALNLGQEFDIVFASHGVLCWIADIDQWFGVAAKHLKPGGFLYLLDGHPFADVFDIDDPGLRELRVSSKPAYFTSGPERIEWPHTYASTEGIDHPTNYQWTHGIGGIVNAASGAGLAIESVHEFPFSAWQRFGFMKFDGEWWRIGGDPIPLMLSIKARKPL